ncbi:hypothetical protein U3516DRAFT_517409, partial [Neocallimastix sp. 'constans']
KIFFHCDFEKDISNAAKKVFPDINIKYRIWHYKRALEIKEKNKLCLKEVENNINLDIHYKFISNFPFINPEYINDIYNKIKSECFEYKYDNFLEFLEYFEITYLKDDEIKHWNYYNNIEHITNNASESFNNYLYDLFPKKSHFYKFLLTLQKVDSLFYDDYKMRKSG